MTTEKKPHRKADRATIQARIDEVLRVRLDGGQYHQILQHSADAGWGGKPGVGLSERTIREYMRRADELIASRRTKSRRLLIAMHLARRESLYARALNAASHRDALACLDSMAKMEGLFADAREMKDLLKLVAEQNQRIKDLEERLRVAGDATTDDPTERPAA